MQIYRVVPHTKRENHCKQAIPYDKTGNLNILNHLPFERLPLVPQLGSVVSCYGIGTWSASLDWATDRYYCPQQEAHPALGYGTQGEYYKCACNIK